MSGCHDRELKVKTMSKINTIRGRVDGACVVGGGLRSQAARLRDPGRQGTGG